MVTNSIVVITLNSLLLSITEEARQRTIGAYVTYYSKSDQDVNASIKVLPKVDTVAYGSARLRELLMTKFE